MQTDNKKDAPIMNQLKPILIFTGLLCCAMNINASELLAQTPSASVASPQEQIKVTSSQVNSNNVSLDFKDADIGNVLRILSLKSKVNIVAGPEVKGVVTIRLEDVPWDKALDVVLRTYGYVYERKENIIRVTTKENLATEELATETFVLNYTTAEEAQEAIQDILTERGRVKPVSRTNMLVVTDVPTNLFKIRQVIERLDRSTPQAYIDAKIVKTSLLKGENLGIEWSPNATLVGAQRPVTFPFDSFNRAENSSFIDRTLGNYFPRVASTTAAANSQNARGFPEPAAAVASSGTNLFTLGRLDFTAFQAVLNFLRTRSNTKVVSNPRITVLNNQTATINVGTEIPLPTLERNETSGSFEITGFTYRDTGVVFEVTPHINDADEILVDLKPEISAQDGSTNFGGTGSFTTIPNFTVATAETQVLIKSSETIAIGGLMTDSEADSETKVPVLGDAPLIGKLFRSKRKTSGVNNRKEETLFFITVTVVDSTGEPEISTQSVANEPIQSAALVGTAAPSPAMLQTKQ